MDAIAREMANDAVQVVAVNGSMTWTRADLSGLFARVQNATNWKLAIDRVVTLANDRELLGMREAIIFYTGSVPAFEAIGNNQYRVRAVGYYRTIGA